MPGCLGIGGLDTPVKVEITIDEPILWPVAQREIMHEYGEPLKVEVSTYSLEEVVAEKLRAILQQLDQLESRGWVRTRAGTSTISGVCWAHIKKGWT